MNKNKYHDSHNKKHNDIEYRLSTLEKSYDSINCTLSKIHAEMDKFMYRMQKSNNSFIRWLVGVVIVSLVLGLFGQYQAFHNVQNDINEIENLILTLPDRAADDRATE